MRYLKKIFFCILCFYLKSRRNKAERKKSFDRFGFLNTLLYALSEEIFFQCIYNCSYLKLKRNKTKRKEFFYRFGRIFKYALSEEFSFRILNCSYLKSRRNKMKPKKFFDRFGFWNMSFYMLFEEFSFWILKYVLLCVI